MAAKKAKKAIDQFRDQFDKLRKESIETVATANRIVSKGVQKLADKELNALNDYYQELVSQVKSARRGESIKDLAARQLDLMQDTVNKVIANARESFATVAEVRDELTKLVQRKSDKFAMPELEKVKAPAKKAFGKVKKAAVEAEKKAVEIVSRLDDTVEAAAIEAAETVGKAVRTATASAKSTVWTAAKAGAVRKAPAKAAGGRKAAVTAEAPAPKAARGKAKVAPARRGRKPKASAGPVAAPSARADKPKKTRVMKPRAPKAAPAAESPGEPG